MNHAVFFDSLQAPGLIYDCAESHSPRYSRESLSVYGGGSAPCKYKWFYDGQLVRDARSHPFGRQARQKSSLCR